MNYSPKLKSVMAEIKQLLKENDIAGIVVLHTIEGTPTVEKDGTAHVMGFTEYLFHINTSYSAASFDETTNRFKILGKREHYSSMEEKNGKIAGAVNMFDHLGEWSGKCCLQTQEMAEMIKPMLEFKDTTGGHETSHEEQSN